MSSGINNKYTGYHNRRTIRLKGYDYSSPGYYFVTICIHDRKKKLFGDIMNGAMVENEYGRYTEQCWREMPTHFPHARNGEFVVMPNHVHGIIEIVGANNYSPLQFQYIEPLEDNLKIISSIKHNRPRGTSKTVGSIVRGFKIGVTKLIHQQEENIMVWQRGFYDHIIRDANSLYFIGKYIRENPLNWEMDCEYHIDREIQEFSMLDSGDE